jgi:hypothetical protein
VEWERGFTNMKIGINEIEEIRVWAQGQGGAGKMEVKVKLLGNVRRKKKRV